MAFKRSWVRLPYPPPYYTRTYRQTSHEPGRVLKSSPVTDPANLNLSPQNVLKKLSRLSSVTIIFSIYS